MTTRVFRARTLIDARLAATAALGEDAVVLTTREVRRPGLLGVLGATEVESARRKAPAARSPLRRMDAPRVPFTSATSADDRPRSTRFERTSGARSAQYGWPWAGPRRLRVTAT